MAVFLAARLRFPLPGLPDAVSASPVFVLAAIENLSVSGAVAVAALSTLAQTMWRTSPRRKLAGFTLDLSATVTAAFLAARLFSFLETRFAWPVCCTLLALVYFWAQTFPKDVIAMLSGVRSTASVWVQQRSLLPLYAAGSLVGWGIGRFSPGYQWEVLLVCLLLAFLLQRFSSAYFAQLERDRAHMLAMNGLHLRTINALALAIDAKDQGTHDHLQRVQLYATEIGKDLALSDSEMEALTAASVLHDIGKLAVPESIISKPGKLTRAEFEKMKIHPVVGAEILESVEFPYPVAPIVRSHHERWDGKGYPYGLQGEEIPIGARILTVVDTFDALASDRQYRRALPMDEAMAQVASEAGTAFDPRVVAALQARYRELENLCKSIESHVQPALSLDIRIPAGASPAAGLEASAPPGRLAPAPPRTVKRGGGVTPVREAEIGRPAAVSLETELTTLDLPAAGACFLDYQEALTVAAVRIRRVIPYNTIAFAVCESEMVRVTLAFGGNAARLESLAIQPGAGLMGWVAEFRKPILNGSPAVEPGYFNPPGSTQLRSALALPVLDERGELSGIIALYREDRDAFSEEDLEALSQACPALSRLLSSPQSSADPLLQMARAIQSGPGRRGQD